MRPKVLPLFFCLVLMAAPAMAAISLPSEGVASLPVETEGPANAAMQVFREGRHFEAIEMAIPLAGQGNGDALFMLGFAHETGQGADPSRENAIANYEKAFAAGHTDAGYRLAAILLAGEEEAERNQAREILEKAAKTDPATAGRILGEAYLRGSLTKDPDFDQALFWWTSAADAGDTDSLLLSARLYEGQFGFPDKMDLEKAMAAFAKAAGLGDGPAMAALGSRLLSGDEAIRDEAKGREWLQKAIEADEATAFLALGDYEENVKKDLKAALSFYERGKDAGQIDCTLRAATFYIEGLGTDKDVSRGIKLLESAAKEGSAVAHFQLAVRRLTGETPDVAAGYVHLVAASNGGLTEAQNELGLLYLSGKMGVSDPAAGVAWLTRAAQGGHPQAQNNLATLYERGAGVERSLANAGQLYSLAANQGHGQATLALARMYGQGIGTAADLPKAWALATLAGERGEEDGTSMAGEIAAKLDEEQLAAARKELKALTAGDAAEAPAE
jgi:TPR repeat protein